MPEPKGSKKRKANLTDGKARVSGDQTGTDDEVKKNQAGTHDEDKENRPSPGEGSAEDEPKPKALKQSRLPFSAATPSSKPQDRPQPAQTKSGLKQGTLVFGKRWLHLVPIESYRIQVR